MSQYAGSETGMSPADGQPRGERDSATVAGGGYTAARYTAAVAYAFVTVSASLLAAGASVLFLALVTVLAYLLFLALWRSQFRPHLSYVDPALVFLLVIVLYTAFPLVTLYAFSYNFGPSGDNRLNNILLTDDLISTVWLCSNFVMAGFGSAYLAFRRTRMPGLPEDCSDVVPALWAGAALSALVSAGIFVLRGAGSYLDEYQFIATLPTVAVQAINVSNALFIASVFGLMIVHVRDRLPLALAIGIGAAGFYLATSQARSGLVLILMGLLVAYDLFRRRVSPPGLAVGAVAIVLGFLALGFLRESGEIFSDAAGRNEFLSLFVTALDIRQLYITGSTLNMNADLLLSDLFRLVPQQFLTFEKVDPASWYVGTFYPEYAELGGGMAFGMIAESILGGGPIAALIRGLALGTATCLVFNLLTARDTIWRTIIYTWFLVTLYQSFRDTTFTLAGRFVFQFGPAVLVLIVLSRMIPGRRTPAP